MTADPREVIAQCVHAAGMCEGEDPIGCGLACREGAWLILAALTAAGLAVVPATGRRANEQGRSVGASDCRPNGSGGVPAAERREEWGIRHFFEDGTRCCVDGYEDRAAAEEWLPTMDGGEVVHRTVWTGPWEPVSGRDGDDIRNG